MYLEHGSYNTGTSIIYCRHYIGLHRAYQPVTCMLDKGIRVQQSTYLVFGLVSAFLTSGRPMKCALNSYLSACVSLMCFFARLYFEHL